MLSSTDLNLLRNVIKEEIKTEINDLKKNIATQSELLEMKKIMATKDDIQELETTIRKDIQKLSDQMIEFTEAMLEPSGEILHDHEARISKLEENNALG